jgi:hypothetical protein
MRTTIEDRLSARTIMERFQPERSRPHIARQHQHVGVAARQFPRRGVFEMKVRRDLEFHGAGVGGRVESRTARPLVARISYADFAKIHPRAYTDKTPARQGRIGRANPGERHAPDLRPPRAVDGDDAGGS